MKLRKNRRTKWTEEERPKLKSLFKEFDGDIGKISNELRRGEDPSDELILYGFNPRE